jgi:hypothetical protein
VPAYRTIYVHEQATVEYSVFVRSAQNAAAFASSPW